MDHDKGEPRQADAAEDKRKDSLSSLVTRIAIDFLHVKPERIDDVVRRALASICTFLDTRRGFVMLVDDEDAGAFRIVDDWASTDSAAPAPAAITLPWLYRKLSTGDGVMVDEGGGLPGEAIDEQAWFDAYGIQSAVFVPMIAKSGLVGAFGVGASEAHRSWPDATTALMRVIGDVIVTARERKAAHTALQRRMDAEEVIRSIATMVIGLGADEMDDGYARALEVIGSFLEVDRCYVRLAAFSESESPRLFGWRHDDAPEFDSGMAEYDLLKSFSWAMSVFEDNENIVLNSTAEIPPGALNELDFVKRFSVNAVVAAPILANGGLVGVLVTEMNYAPRDWSDIDIMLVSIAGQILGGMRVRQMVDEERRRLESQVQHAQKFESMGVLAGGIAHDFNNLLVGILGNAELMLMDAPDEFPQRKNLEQIENAARRAADLVNQLLTYTGKGHFKVEPIDTTDLIKHLATLVRTVIPKKIDVQIELEDNLPFVAGDATQLRQVIMNLVTNAADAIGEISGKLLVCTGFGTFNAEFLGHTVTGADLAAGDYVIIEVTDTGSGMDEETIARIFDPFFTTKFAGRGLGLAATLGIVRAHHGTIHVMSWPQKGTTIQVLLPATAYERPEPAADAGQLVASEKGGTVLVIDDEISVRRVTRSVLEHFGYDVLVAENGLRALRVLEQNPRKVDLVILDMSMPKMDGVETLRRIRELGEQVPVMLTSGYTEVEISDRIGELDASGFIGKPFSPKDLIQQVRKLL